MEPLTYLHLQMRLEGIGLVDGCLMRQVEVVPGEAMPLMLIAQLANGVLVRYYDETLSSDLQNELAAIDIEFSILDPLLEALRLHHLRFEAGHYKTYIFPACPSRDTEIMCLSRDEPKVKAFRFDGFAEKVYTVEQNGSLISACASARENGSCGEAWVYTHPEYRHHGYARRVVNAWAASLMKAGKVPFYSHEIQNAASANLARRLGLQPVFEEIALTRL